MKYRSTLTTVLTVACLIMAIGASAQETYTSSGKRPGTKRRVQEKGFDPQKLIVGGGLGLGFGDITSIAVSPVIGYRFTDKISAGIGLGFQYYRVKDYFLVYNGVSGQQEYFPLKSTFFYPSIWGRYVIYNNIFVHLEAEYDMQKFKAYETDSDPNSSTYGLPVPYNVTFNSPALLVGGGLRQPITDRSSLVIIALYDVIQDKYSPYKNRIDFRIGFNVGF
jgi:long-subunit fatty acid transport protein